MSTNLFELARIIAVSWGQIINYVHRVSPEIFDFRPSQIVSRCQVYDGAVGAISVSTISGFHELVKGWSAYRCDHGAFRQGRRGGDMS